MTDTNRLIQESIVERRGQEDPEYQRLLKEYLDNPFFDITKDSIAAYVAKKESAHPEEKPADVI